MTRAGKNSATANTQVRQDIYVYNEATAFLITSKRMGGKGWNSNDKKWEKAVNNGELIPIELYQDDPLLVRLVVNDKLSVQEESEWLGKFYSGLIR